MKKVLFLSLVLPFMFTNAMNPQPSEMKYKIWRQFIDILQHRQDLNSKINPFLGNLNGENLNDPQHIPFLMSLSDDQLKVLHKCGAINDDKVKSLSKGDLLEKWNAETTNLESENSMIKIIEQDNMEELQQLIKEGKIDPQGTVTTSFNGVKMEMPIIHFTVMRRATKCFKYLLVNGYGNLEARMQEQNPDPSNRYWQPQHIYE